MSQTESGSMSPLVGVLKGVAVVICSGFVFSVGSFLTMMHPPGPPIVPVWLLTVSGAVLCGLTAGCLTWLFGLRRRGAMLSPVLASLPILFSWFIGGARSRSSTFRHQGDKLVSVVKWHVDYSQLYRTLVAACIVSVFAFVICRVIANRKR